MEFNGLRFSESGGQLTVDGLVDRYYNFPVTIPAEVQGKPVVRIAEGAFMNTKITGVYIAFPLQSIDASAFMGCEDLEFVRLYHASSIAYSSVLHIGKSAFESCSNLETINVCRSLCLENNAFKNCHKLKYIDAVKSLYSHSFLMCSELSTIYFSNNADVSKFDVSGSCVNFCIFNGNAIVSDLFITSVLSTDCRIECYDSSNLCDLVYEGIFMNVVEQPF